MFSKLYRIIRRVFDTTLRPRLPPKQVCLGGVEAYRGSIFDRTLTDIPEYEAASRNALETHVDEGDHVRIVGGGSGVTAVIAAKSGAATVEVVEAASRSVGCAEKTVALNNLWDSITILHGHIGEVQNARMGELGPSIPPAWCSECDVLELDCEGSELDILSSFEKGESLPRVIIVETHGAFGSPTADVRDELNRLGYDVGNSVPVDADEDLFVLTAVRGV